MTRTLQLPEGELSLTGRIVSASNATFVGTIDDITVVYKPVAGERPLWDFPDGDLARREVASYMVSEALGWDLVPPTWLREGPHGTGMVQLWREPDPDQEAVTLVPAGETPSGTRHVLDGIDAEGSTVSLVHEDSPVLRQMAVMDVVINNADRKGGHVLEMPDGHRHACDHGLTFHTDPKLRTVLWGWLGEPLTDDELTGVRRLRGQLDESLDQVLSSFLTEREVQALVTRCDDLLASGTFPAPSGDMPAVPWPPF
ncbi:SCO1664 family protein [Aeromicrobium sp. CTD01-1L150]|uniref:SCO1664 family protein n=1 Tax=Aeromicrobium sp. CTD01-1L150 TaxID=3341830 RepID=UPI0035BED457